MLSKNKFFLIIVVLMSLSLLSGCWDIKEINQRALPLIIGVSKKNKEQYEVTLSLPIIKEKGKTRIVTETGESVSSILGHMRTNAAAALDYSQIRLIVIHASLATIDPEWRKMITYLMISKQIPSKVLVAITDDNIEPMFATISKLKFRGTAVYDFFNKGTNWAPEVSNTRLWEVYQSMFSYTNDIAVPIVNSGTDTIFDFEGSAALRNGKVTRMSPSENHLVSLFQHRNTLSNTEGLGIATILVKSSRLQIRPIMKNHEPRAAVELALKISILEKDEGVSEDRIKKELEKRIEQRFNRMLQQAQVNKTDIFGFGQHFRTRIPYDELQNWRERYYPKLIANFQVHVRME